MTMSEKQKMLAGELYRPGDPEILADQAAAKAWMVRYNAALGETPAVRRALLKELLGSVGDGAVEGVAVPLAVCGGTRRKGARDAPPVLM